MRTVYELKVDKWRAYFVRQPDFEFVWFGDKSTQRNDIAELRRRYD